ncbi:peptidase inhibitor clitocypin domain-containing protein [Rhizoctonia solani]|uniref:Peptidase inhibitor clitocypin domain-containing protein n=1 Tax=Rhizoctonia solani TaxID=456999 RepID=A0A8H8NRX7_9AGAM|nr:peptidase inhibitor clitocypin domain-containing protein [Rhizoctonia solani]QRW18799.1 peptidase inhibitor clitocypin domain-containing protein [Rhizoctonia solani]
MSLRPGRYLARFIVEGDQDFVGGMYATGKGPGRPIGLDPNRPEFYGQQQWEFELAPEGGRDVYTINSRPGESWSYESENPIPEEPIILDGAKLFRVQRSEGSQGGDIFTIASTKSLIGATLYVGAGENQRVLTFIPVPVIPGAHGPLWEFKRLEE